MSEPAGVIILACQPDEVAHADLAQALRDYAKWQGIIEVRGDEVRIVAFLDTKPEQDEMGTLVSELVEALPDSWPLHVLIPQSYARYLADLAADDSSRRLEASRRRSSDRVGR